MTIAWPMELDPSFNAFVIGGDLRQTVHRSFFTGAEQRRSLASGVRYSGTWGIDLVRPELTDLVRPLLARLSTGEDFDLPLLWGSPRLPWQDAPATRVVGLELKDDGDFEWRMTGAGVAPSPSAGDWFAAYAGAPSQATYLQSFEVVSATAPGATGVFRTASRPRDPASFDSGSGARIGAGAQWQVIRARLPVDASGALAVPRPSWSPGEMLRDFSFAWEEAL